MPLVFDFDSVKQNAEWGYDTLRRGNKQKHTRWWSHNRREGAAIDE